jgi:hypothetical protein
MVILKLLIPVLKPTIWVNRARFHTSRLDYHKTVLLRGVDQDSDYFKKALPFSRIVVVERLLLLFFFLCELLRFYPSLHSLHSDPFMNVPTYFPFWLQLDS